MAYKSRVSDAVVRRLPMYYRHLKELEKAGVVRISSQELGERMNLTASQIRQDINCFGGFGQQGYGYHVANLKERIGEILGLHKQYHMIIVGAGNIGRAVANYAGFSREGFNIQAIFDVSEALVGIDVHGILVQPMEKLETWMSTHQVDIAVLSVPKGVAQDADHQPVNWNGQFINGFGFELPQTGGTGRMLYAAGGLLLTAAGALLLYHQARRRRGDKPSS